MVRGGERWAEEEGRLYHDMEQNSTELLGDNGLEESEGIDPVHLEEWMEAVDAYKADAELRCHNEFCMFPFLSFGVS